MNEFYLGTILLWPLPWLPNNYAYCDGQVLTIASNTALFSLIDDTYGGDGKTTFALPDLRSRIPIGANMGGINPMNLTPVEIGANAGVEDVQLIKHSHVATVINIPLNISTANMLVSSQPADEKFPILGSSIAAPMSTNGSSCIPALGFNYVEPDTQVSGLEVSNPIVATTGNITISSSGTAANGTYANMQPFLGLNYIICTNGLYPPIEPK